MSTTPQSMKYDLEMKAADPKAGMTVEEIERFTRECRDIGFTGVPKVFVGFRAQITRMVARVERGA